MAADAPSEKETAVPTGQESERLIFKQRCKLYRFHDGQWKQRGSGEITYLQHEDSGMVRMVMRQDKTFKVVLNHYISPLPDNTLKVNFGNDRSRVWTALDYSDDGSDLMTFAVKFPKSEEASEFESLFNKAKEINGESDKDKKEQLPKWVDPYSDEAPAKVQDETKVADPGSVSQPGAQENPEAENISQPGAQENVQAQNQGLQGFQGLCYKAASDMQAQINRFFFGAPPAQERSVDQEQKIKDQVEGQKQDQEKGKSTQESEEAQVDIALAKDEAKSDAPLADSEKKSGDATPADGTAAKSPSGVELWKKILDEKQYKPFAEEDLKKLWKKYDKDHSEQIDHAELRALYLDLMDALFEKLEAPIDDEARTEVKAEVDAMVKETVDRLDKDHNNKLSWEEFKHLTEIKLL